MTTNTHESRRALRAAYRGTVESARKQLGTRALRDAEQFAVANAPLAELRFQTARFHLPYALELTRRVALAEAA